MSLEKLRDEIDKIDNEIVKALSERLKVVQKVGEFKKANGMPLYAPDRWNQVLMKISEIAERNEVSPEFVMSIYNEIHEHALELEGAEKVYFLGPKSSYSHIISLKMFSDGEFRHFPLRSFEEIRELVLSKNVIGILPFENSITSNIHENIDAIFSGKFQIIGEGVLNIELHLMTNKGQKFEQIQKVYSHPKALAQCSDFLKKHNIVGIPMDSTSAGAEKIAIEGDPSTAAIGSDLIAETLELELLKKNIGNFKKNQTRFIAVRSKEFNENVTIKKDDEKMSLLIELKHEVGSLHRLLDAIAKAGGNLSKIESRPIPETDWKYSFLIDVMADDLNSVYEKIKKESESVDLLGSYKLLNK